MLSKELEFTLNMAFRDAREKRHEFMTVEHLLLALLDNPAASKVLRACGAGMDKLRGELAAYIEESTPMLSAKDERETQPTLGFQRVLQRAVFHVQSSGKKEVNGANVLVAIFGERESQAVYFLGRQSITRLDVVNYISHGISKVHDNEDGDSFTSGSEEEKPAEQPSRSPLEAYASNLNEQALLGKIDPLIGRRTEVQRTIQILCRRRKNNPLYVGEAGVGKTAIAEGLAKMIVEGEVPEVLEESTIYALDLGALLAGTKYRGDFEKAPQGRARPTGQAARRHSLHRRDPHHHRRGRRVRRGDGCVQSDQADARLRRAALHRLHHLPRVPGHLRKGPRAVAAIPEDRHHRAERRRSGKDPERTEVTLRRASPDPVLPSGDARRGRALAPLHPRPLPARQGDRRHRRSGRLPEAAAALEAPQDGRRHGS